MDRPTLKACYGSIKLAYRLIKYYPSLTLEEVDYDVYWQVKRQKKMGIITSFQQQRADWILPKIEVDSTVLDVGSGDGGVLLYLLNHQAFTPIAADISDYALAFLRDKGIETVKLNINNLDEISELPEVDHIIVFEVLEHVQNPEQFLKILEKKAQKSIFFSIPNTGYFPYRLRMLRGSFVMQWCLHPGEHLRFWTYKDLQWWLAQLGYAEQSEIHIYEGMPFLNKIWGSLFGMAFVCQIKVESS